MDSEVDLTWRVQQKAQADAANLRSKKAGQITVTEKNCAYHLQRETLLPTSFIQGADLIAVREKICV